MLGLTWRVKMPIGINTTTAIAIHKDKIRAVRTPLLTALDVEYQRAQEVGSAPTEIVAKKQELSDAREAVE